MRELRHSHLRVALPILALSLACSASDGSTDDVASTTGGSGGASSDATGSATTAGTLPTGTSNPDTGTSLSDTTDDPGDSTAASETSGSGSSADGSDSTTGPGVPLGPSPGCGNSTQAPGSFVGIEVDVGGLTRTFNLVVPPAHDGETPIPLVLAFHGWFLNAQTQANMSQMSVTANERGFAIAYPQGVGESWNAGSCCGTAFDQGVDDVAFTRALVQQAGEALCLDESRIYATGFSNGGFMSHRLACEASDVFAAIGPVAGVLMIPDAECTPPRAVPVMHFHGTDDLSVAFGGNGKVPHISVAVSTADWVARNGCDPDPEVTFQQADTTCETWSNCGDDGAEVILCTIEGMGHCWPGDPVCTGLMDTPSLTLPASDALADFFEAHPMP